MRFVLEITLDKDLAAAVEPAQIDPFHPLQPNAYGLADDLLDHLCNDGPLPAWVQSVDGCDP